MMASITENSSQPPSNGKPMDIVPLMKALDADVGEKNLSPQQRNAYLEDLKSYTCTIRDAAPLRSREGVLLLCRYGLDGGNAPGTARVALKGLANVMLLDPSTRQHFVDLGYASKTAELLKVDDREDQFLAARLLFLLTYETKFDFEDLFDRNQLSESIRTNLSQHADQGSGIKRQQMDELALSELLKLLFNLNQFYPKHRTGLNRSLAPVLKLLGNLEILSPPLQSPLKNVINCLHNLDLGDKDVDGSARAQMFPHSDADRNVNRLVSILDPATRQYKDEELEELAVPLVTLLRRIYEIAPSSVKKRMQTLLLPSDAERVRPLGRSDTLPSSLLRLSLSPLVPSLRESISYMLFELSDRDAATFVRNVGYGFASGFLMTHGISLPGNALEASSANKNRADAGVQGAEAESENGHGGVNPITGQRRDTEESDSEDERSEEEKLRDAERLFVLFERLKATGVVDVQNPVATAVREGRFEELD